MLACAGGPRIWSQLHSGASTSAATGWGVSVVRAESSSSRGTSRISVSAGRVGRDCFGVVLAGDKNAVNAQPGARVASSSRFGPSMPTGSPPRTGSPGRVAVPSTGVFCLLCTMRTGIDAIDRIFQSILSCSDAREHWSVTRLTCTMAGAVIASVFVASVIREPR